MTPTGGRGWYAKVEIIDAPQLQLVLPARKEMVQNDALEGVREACETAIFRTIAREGHHRLPHQQWLRAQALGISLPEAAPFLHLWTPRTAETNDIFPGERIAGEPMFIMPTQPAHIEQSVSRALKSTDALSALPVRAMSEFAGYAWYDALPRVVGLSFEVATDGKTLHYDEHAMVHEALESGFVDRITLELAVQAMADSPEPAEILALPAEALIVETECEGALGDKAVLLAARCTLTPADLASLLEAACFNPSEDCGDDSYETQQTAFEMHARYVANGLLLGEDAAIIERIRDAVRDNVWWLIPDNRPIAIRTKGNRIEVAFDIQPTLEAAE